MLKCRGRACRCLFVVVLGSIFIGLAIVAFLSPVATILSPNQGAFRLTVQPPFLGAFRLLPHYVRGDWWCRHDVDFLMHILCIVGVKRSVGAKWRVQNVYFMK